jgi:crotonobetainyl-CoA:carnitine CoA-transferase CaiB-like acyl-CoA transferase
VTSTPVAARERPLEGIKVLDFTHGVAGPYCSMVLGDLGCDVIKIERPGRGDPTRYMNVSEAFRGDIPRVGGDYFLAINRNKRAITVELKSEQGREICNGLARWCDVALQSFRPGVMTGLGLDYAALSRINPRLIYGNLTAYGRHGPLAQKAGMDVAVQARSGVMRLTGKIGDTEPMRPGVSLADFGGGIFLSTAIITALFVRERTGQGQEVDMSLLDATMSLLSNYTVACYDGGARLKPVGSGHPQLVPYQAFPTSDGYIVIGAGTNKIYRQMCEAMGQPALRDNPLFATNQDRVARRDELVPQLSDAMRARSTADWMAIFEAADVPCAPVNEIHEALHDPQLAANNMIQAVEHPDIGTLHVTGSAFHFRDTDEDIRRHPPMLGEHTDEVLRDVLGFDEARIGRLHADCVI